MKVFQLKVALLAWQVATNNFCHFTLQKTEVPADCAERYGQQVDVLREGFERRFSNFERIEPEFNLLTFPFTADANSAPKGIHMELIDLKTGNTPRDSCKSVSLIDLCNSLRDEKFVNLKHFGAKMFLFLIQHIIRTNFFVFKN